MGMGAVGAVGAVGAQRAGGVQAVQLGEAGGTEIGIAISYGVRATSPHPLTDWLCSCSRVPVCRFAFLLKETVSNMPQCLHPGMPALLFHRDPIRHPIIEFYHKQKYRPSLSCCKLGFASNALIVFVLRLPPML